MPEPRRIGLLGGSFDPPHIGHFICARAVAERLGLQAVIVTPTAEHPLKHRRSMAPPEVRWEMVCAITRGDPVFKPSRVELDRGGVSYTVDTLELLRREYPPESCKLFCIIGSDAVRELDKWRSPERIFPLAKVVVMTRAGFPAPSPPNHWLEKVMMVETPAIDISSTAIRERVARELPVELMVGREVAEIIRERGLYKKPLV